MLLEIGIDVVNILSALAGDELVSIGLGCCLFAYGICIFGKLTCFKV